MTVDAKQPDFADPRFSAMAVKAGVDTRYHQIATRFRNLGGMTGFAGLITNEVALDQVTGMIESLGREKILNQPHRHDRVPIRDLRRFSDHDLMAGRAAGPQELLFEPFFERHTRALQPALRTTFVPAIAVGPAPALEFLGLRRRYECSRGKVIFHCEYGFPGVAVRQAPKRIGNVKAQLMATFAVGVHLDRRKVFAVEPERVTGRAT